MSILLPSPRLLGGLAPTLTAPVSQRRFLEALGAKARLAALSARATPAQRRELESGLRRLLDPGEMGELFKAVALASPGSAASGGV